MMLSALLAAVVTQTLVSTYDDGTISNEFYRLTAEMSHTEVWDEESQSYVRVDETFDAMRYVYHANDVDGWYAVTNSASVNPINPITEYPAFLLLTQPQRMFKNGELSAYYDGVTVDSHYQHSKFRGDASVDAYAQPNALYGRVEITSTSASGYEGEWKRLSISAPSVAYGTGASQRYKFSHWSWERGVIRDIEDAHSPSTRFTAQVSRSSKSATMIANYVFWPYESTISVEVSKQGLGTAECTPTSSKRNQGETSVFAFSATPAKGYSFATWWVEDGGSVWNYGDSHLELPFYHRASDRTIFAMAEFYPDSEITDMPIYGGSGAILCDGDGNVIADY